MNEVPPPVEVSPSPAIWNPNAAASWSLLFSPCFGSFIHAKNATALGRLEEAAANMKWFYGNLAFLGLTLVLAVAAPGIGNGAYRIAGLAILLTWYFTVAKKQVLYVKETYGVAYTRKPWGQAIGIAVGCFVAFLIIAFIIGFAVALIKGTPAS